MSTIMFVDDEEMILDLLQEYMSQVYGHNVIIAHGGVKAVERYKKQWKEIDLVVLVKLSYNVYNDAITIRN